MKPYPKKTLGIYSLTCCEGCQFEILKDYDDFSQLLKYYDVRNFRLGQEENLPGPFDVSLVEGTPESKEEYTLLREIRKTSAIVIVIGSCAHLGGIQSERNSLPKKMTLAKDVVSIPEVINTDFIVPGCPISHKELFAFLMDIYWNKVPTLHDLAVCFECRQNENQCLLKEGKPCLGPITRGGCDSICVNGGEPCYGRRGATDQADFAKMKEILKPIISDEDSTNMMTIYGDYECEWKRRTDEGK